VLTFQLPNVYLCTRGTSSGAYDLNHESAGE